MKKILTATLAVLVCMALLLSAAMADSLSLSGTVTAGETAPVYAPIGGTVGEVKVVEGQQVKEGDVLYSMKTEKVYAEEDGIVTGIFGQPGDSASTVAERYGAVLYLEGNAAFSVSASTDNAYNSTETKFVHVGETVYLLCRSSSARNGIGIITAVSGTSYTVQVDSGTFIPGDSVDVYRDEKYTAAQKIGRGTVSRVDPTAVSASGSIVRIAVADGAQVKRGDLLLETLDGSFDGLYMSGTEIAAEKAGVVGSLGVSRGGSVQKDSIAAEIYLLDSMKVEAYVPEDSRNLIHEGDTVTIELEADESKTYQGTVTLVSSVAEGSSGSTSSGAGSAAGGSSAGSSSTGSSSEVTYRVVVDFVPDDAVKVGMSVVISTANDEEPEETAAPAKEENTEDASSEENAEDSKEDKKSRPDRPEGMPEMPEGSFPEMPEGGFPQRPDSTTDTTPAEGKVTDENAQP